MYTNILVPLDGSAFAELALPHASALAAKFECKITLVKVCEPAHFYQSVDNIEGVMEDVRQAAVKETTDYLEAVKARLTADGLDVDIDFIEGGNVPSMILEAIEESGADLVVMCTHGRSGIERWRFGSVAERVARHTTVTTVLVRPSKASSGAKASG